MLSLMGKLIPADEPPVTKKVSLFYFDNAAGIDFLPEAYVDITETLPTKLEMLSKHRARLSGWAASGTTRSRNTGDHCQFRGLQAGCDYAEGFRAYRIYGYMPDFKLCRETRTLCVVIGFRRRFHMTTSEPEAVAPSTPACRLRWRRWAILTAVVACC